MTRYYFLYNLISLFLDVHTFCVIPLITNLTTRYLIIPAQNYQSRSAELYHIETWAARNNLHLNHAKCAELIISEPRRSRQFNLPPCISDTTRVFFFKDPGRYDYWQDVCQ